MHEAATRVAGGWNYLVHRGAPEIVEEYVNEGGVWPEVSILFDGTDVVEHKTAVARVVVANQASY